MDRLRQIVGNDRENRYFGKFDGVRLRRTVATPDCERLRIVVGEWPLYVRTTEDSRELVWGR